MLLEQNIHPCDYVECMAYDISSTQFEDDADENTERNDLTASFTCFCLCLSTFPCRDECKML